MELFDIRARRAMRRHITESGLFLHDLAISDIQERLDEINKSFGSIAIVTPVFKKWAMAFPNATLIAPSAELKFCEKRFDLILHVFSLHAMEDPLGQLIQCRRRLNDDGLLLTVAFGGQSLGALRTALAEGELAALGGVSPRVMPMADIRDYGALIQRAGLSLGVADAMSHRVSYCDLWALMNDLRAMGEANCLAERRRCFTPKGAFERAEIEYRRIASEGDKLYAVFELITLTGWHLTPADEKRYKPGVT